MSSILGFLLIFFLYFYLLIFFSHFPIIPLFGSVDHLATMAAAAKAATRLPKCAVAAGAQAVGTRHLPLPMTTIITALLLTTTTMVLPARVTSAAAAVATTNMAMENP